MSVKNFKFVSPGVFINEIDNSFIPKTPETIGPAVVGRATRGIAMEPIKVDSYSQFVEMFGDTIPGGAGGDVYKTTMDQQAPMYGTYAAKAFLRAGVAPLTYVRLLGFQHPNREDSRDAKAGWDTLERHVSVATANAVGDHNAFGTTQAGAQTFFPNVSSSEQLRAAGDAYLNPIIGGGAYGLWVFKSGSAAGTGSVLAATFGEDGVAGHASQQTASLAAVFYLDAGNVALSGTVFGTGFTAENGVASITASIGTLIQSDANGVFSLIHQPGGTATVAGTKKYNFSIDPDHKKYARRVFNTNPQLSVSGNFYPTSIETDMWLGETYEQESRDTLGNSLSQPLVGFITGIGKNGTRTSSPANMRDQDSREARTNWIVGQDHKDSAGFQAENLQKLFRFVGRGHGEWLHKNVKISIDQVRASNNSTTEFGSFSVLVRHISDTDNAIQILERFDNLSLDPTSPNFIARKIGNRYREWTETERRYKYYGSYPNQSKYVYVDVNSDVLNGAMPSDTTLPFGYYGPPKYKDINHILAVTSGSATLGAGVSDDYSGGHPLKVTDSYVILSGATTNAGAPATFSGSLIMSGGLISDTPRSFYLRFPETRIRLSSSDGGLTDVQRCFFGADFNQITQSARHDNSAWMPNRLLMNDFPTDPIGATATPGIDSYGYIFTLDNLVLTGSSNIAYHLSGSRKSGASYTATAGKSWKDLLDAGYNGFTVPLWGGFDGVNIKFPDPFWNGSMSTAATELNSSVYYSIKRAIDTTSEPEVMDMNILTMPGLTNTGLTEHLISVCEDRADALGIIDLENVYLPIHEGQYSGKSSESSRIRSDGPRQAATDLKDRKINTSYGCTFYPWVQTRDENNGQLVWIPPSVAMMGVLASSERKSQLWFAPAGFNRGGLTDGAAGIDVTNVTEKLTSRERDILYDANINPIASFPSTGIVVFGQKTLQERQSALDRINVRRLVIFLKKEISRISTKILFEQNVQATWNRFTGLVEPFLANVKSNFGISDYRLILDESTTTPDLIDQNILYAKIMVKPARAIEYIAIDFVVANTGASFDD
jgi:hypothetical protein